MISPHVGQSVHIIHLRLRQRFCRRILYHIQVLGIGFHKTLPGKRIRVQVLCIEAFCILSFIILQLFKRRQYLRIINTLQGLYLYCRPVNISQFFHGDPRIQRIRYFSDRTLSHSVGDHIRAGVQQHGSFQAVRPVIIMSQTPQTGLDPAKDHRRLLVCPADQISIDRTGVIRAFSHHSAGSIGIRLSPLF